MEEIDKKPNEVITQENKIEDKTTESKDLNTSTIEPVPAIEPISVPLQETNEKPIEYIPPFDFNSNQNIPPYSVVPNPAVQYPQGMPVYTYAGFWLRFGATIIDGLILFIPLIIIFFLFLGVTSGFFVSGFVNNINNHSSDNGSLANYQNLFSLALILISSTYNAFFESSPWQGTPGKKAVGLIVTDLSGNKVTFSRAFVRNLCKIVSQTLFYIGYIMVAFTEKKQALHDMIASTLVLKKV